jgi:hypothetical protein
MTYLAMRSRIDDELLRGGTLDSQINLEILSAINHYKRRRFWFNEGTTTSSTADGTEYQDLPADLYSLDSIRITDSGDPEPLIKRHFVTIENWCAGTVQRGMPSDWAPYKDKVRLYVCPDAVYTLTWAGIVDLGTPSADADTSAWFEEAEELIRQRAKAAVRINYIKDADAIAEQRTLAMAGKPCISALEYTAFMELKRENARRTSTGRIKAHA